MGGGAPAASVVELNVAETPPITSVVDTIVLLLADEVWRTITVWPLVTVATSLRAPLSQVPPSI
jgi:hypothetical protein